MSRRRRKPSPSVARYLAPAAFLAGVTIAVVLVHAGLQGGKSGTATATTLGPTRTVATTTAKTRTHAHPAKRFYTVQTGDTFGSIASKVGISVAQLQGLNPGVSSNALQVGQKLRVK